MCTGLQEALRRKDAIIRVRNAQISSLWDELHTRQPWKNALGDDGRPITFSGTPQNATTAARPLAVLGINTVRCLEPAHDETCAQGVADSVQLQKAGWTYLGCKEPGVVTCSSGCTCRAGPEGISLGQSRSAWQWGKQDASTAG